MSWVSKARCGLLVVAIGVVATQIVACAATASVPQVDPQVVAHGKELYHDLACDSCHGLDAVGSTRTYAPTHNHLAVTAAKRIRAADYTGQATSAAGYVRESIVDPQAHVVEGYRHLRFGMASYAHLSERDIAALVQFLLQQQ